MPSESLYPLCHRNRALLFRIGISYYHKLVFRARIYSAHWNAQACTLWFSVVEGGRIYGSVTRARHGIAEYGSIDRGIVDGFRGRSAT